MSLKNSKPRTEVEHQAQVAEMLKWAIENSSRTHEFTLPKICEAIGFVPDNQKAFTRLKNQFIPKLQEDPIGGIAKYLGRIYLRRKGQENEEEASRTVRKIVREEIISPLKIAIRDESHLDVLVQELQETSDKNIVDWGKDSEPVRAMALRDFYDASMQFSDHEKDEAEPNFDEFIAEASMAEVLSLSRDALENATLKKITYGHIAASASRNAAAVGLFNSEFGRETVDQWHRSASD